MLIINLNYSLKDFENKYIDKYLMYVEYYNVLQIIKSDPNFFEHVERYYNIDNQIVHKLESTSEETHYISIYFDKAGNLTYQSNSYYFIYVTLSLREYSSYYDYYYNIKINKSNVTYTSSGSKGVYLHITKGK